MINIEQYMNTIMSKLAKWKSLNLYLQLREEECYTINTFVDSTYICIVEISFIRLIHFYHYTLFIIQPTNNGPRKMGQRAGE